MGTDGADDPFFTDTIGKVARGAGLCDATIRTYADDGLLDYRLDSTGRRLFRPGAAAEARRIHLERQARRRGRDGARAT